MNYGRVLSISMVIQQFLIALVYLYQKDFKHAAYWFVGGCSILSVSLM